MATLKLNKSILPNTDLSSLQQFKSNVGGIYNNVANGINNNLNSLGNRMQNNLGSNYGASSMNGAIVPNNTQGFLGNSLPTYAPTITNTPTGNTKPTGVNTTSNNIYTPTYTAPAVNPNGLTNEQIAQGYSTIQGDFNPVTGERWNPGSMGEAAQGAGIDLGQDTGYNYVGQDGNIYNSITGQIQGPQGGQETTAEEQMAETLKAYQGQIDAINNMYADQLNNSRIVNSPTYKAREDQNRLQQIQGGIASSPMGSAQTNNVQTANQQEQAANEAIINAQKANAINSIMGEVRTTSTKALEEKKAAKAASADEYVKYLNGESERKSTRLSGAIKSLINSGYKLEDLTPEQVKELGGELAVKAEYNSQKATIDAEAATQDLETRKAEANIKQSEASAASSYSSAQNAKDRLAFDREKATTEKETAYKTYDSKTIPEDIKGQLFSDITANNNSKRKDRKTLNEFIASYPEIDTDYLTELYEANK